MKTTHNTKHVATITLRDPDSKLPVEVEVRKDIETDELIGFDGNYLSRLDEDEQPTSPYDNRVTLVVPDDEGDKAVSGHFIALNAEQLKNLSTLLSMVTGTLQAEGLKPGINDAVLSDIDHQFKKWREISAAVSSAIGFEAFSEPKRLKRFRVAGPEPMGHLVTPEPGPVVVFEWVGSGDTPEKIALDAFNNIQQADNRPMCTVVMPDGEKHDVDLEHVDEDGNSTDDAPEEGDSQGNYVSLEECRASGLHLKSCDKDGFCNNCGEQDNDEDDESQD